MADVEERNGGFEQNRGFDTSGLAESMERWNVNGVSDGGDICVNWFRRRDGGGEKAIDFIGLVGWRPERFFELV